MTYRLILEEHRHEVQHDELDEFQMLPVRAVIRDGGPAVELGGWSLSCSEAALLGESLRILARLAEPDHSARPAVDIGEVVKRIRDAQDDHHGDDEDPS